MPTDQHITDFDILQKRAKKMGFKLSLETDHSTWSYVTLVFFDLVDSTNLSQVVENSVLRKYVEYYHLLCKHCCSNFGGMLINVIGDGVVACFGYPQSVGDEARRAVEACNQILDELSHIDKLFYEHTGHHFYVRLGIHSGDIMIHDGVIKNDVFGKNVNLTARIEGSATQNSIVISDATLLDLDESFRYRFLGDHRLKGINDKIKLYVVEGILPREDTFHQTRQRLPNICGRTMEIERFKMIFESILKTQTPQTISVQGQAGVGKTRLIQGFREHTTESVYWLTVYPVSVMNNNFLESLRAFLSRYLLLHTLPDHAKKKRIHNLLKRFYGSKAHTILPYWLYLLHIDRRIAQTHDTHSLYEAIFDSLVQWIRYLSLLKPVILCFEEMDWRDETAMLFIEKLQKIDTSSMCLILASRTPPPTRMDHVFKLQALLPEETRSMALNLEANLSSKALEAVINRSDGMPLYIRELINMAHRDDGFIETSSGLLDFSPEFKIPLTLRSLLSMRVDSLKDGRDMLIAASVLGRSFDQTTLKALMPQLTEDEFENRLDILKKHRVIDQTGSLLFFEHLMIQEESYHKLTSIQTMRYHRRAADHLIEHHNDQRGEIAEHLFRCNQFGSALGYFMGAIDDTIEESQFGLVLQYGERALESISQLDDGFYEEKAIIFSARITALSALYGASCEQLESAYQKSINLSIDMENKSLITHFKKGLQIYYAHVGKKNLVGSLKDLFANIPPEEQAVSLNVHYASAVTYFSTGELDKSLYHFKQSRHLLETNHDTKQPISYETSSLVLANMGYLCVYRGEIEKAYKCMEDSIQNSHNRAIDFIFTQSINARIAQRLNNADKVRYHCENIWQEVQDRHLLTWQASIDILMGWAESYKGHANGLKRIEKGLTLYKESNSTHYYNHGLIIYAEQCLKHNEHSKAKTAINETLENLPLTDIQVYEAEAHRIFAHCQTDENLKIHQLEKALKLATDKNIPIWQVRCLTDLGAHNPKAYVDYARPLMPLLTKNKDYIDYAAALKIYKDLV
jgi:class 3 adenylate cyclase